MPGPAHNSHVAPNRHKSPANEPATVTGLTVRQVAARYRVSPDKVRAWIARGELRAVNTAAVKCGKPRWVILPDALVEFERSRTPAVPPKPQVRKPRLLAVDYYP